MRSFIHIRFQGHPVIVKDITMFMVTKRVDPAKLEAMKSRLADPDLLLKEMKVSNKRQEDNYNTLKRSLDNLMNEFRAVKAKVAAAKL
jgi:archaellum component FlaC